MTAAVADNLLSAVDELTDRIDAGPVPIYHAEDYLNFFIIAIAGASTAFIDSDELFDSFFLSLGDTAVKRWEWSSADVIARLSGLP